MLAGTIICVQYLAKIDTAILTDDSTEQSPINRPSTGWVGAMKLSVAVCAGCNSWGIVAVPVDDSRESIAFYEY